MPSRTASSPPHLAISAPSCKDPKSPQVPAREGALLNHSSTAAGHVQEPRTGPTIP
jgi:hypothetical protein